MNISVSVVIPAYQAAHCVGACLQSLLNQSYAEHIDEIILVDNGSNDATVEIAKEYDGVTVLVQPKKGAAAARNMGIAHATGDIICFTDADCVPQLDWVESLCRPILLSKEVIGMKGTYLTNQKEIVARFVQIEYEDKYDLLRPEKYINFIDTYSAVYWRDVLLANEGGFDEGIFFAEDRELAYRIASRGYKMAFEPNAIVYHLHSNSFLKYFKKKLFIGYWTAQTVRRFPQRGVKDSHTPQVLKIQMGLMLLFVASLAGALFFGALAAVLPAFLWGGLAAISGLLLLAFCATTVPFVRKAWGKDKAVALASPPLLAIRGIALSLGYTWGVLRPTDLALKDPEPQAQPTSLLKKGVNAFGSTVGLFVTILMTPFKGKAKMRRMEPNEEAVDGQSPAELKKL